MTGDKTPRSSTGSEPLQSIDPEQIRVQLDRILASREFHATSRIRDFLKFIVAETLAGKADRLKGYTIATEVFGRNGDFDAAQDPIVRIQAGRLRRALERYYLVAGGQDEIIIDMPKGRYIPTFVRRTPPPAPPAADTAAQELVDLSRGPAVAVMPLQDLTLAADQAFFAVGLAEEIVTELNRYQDIVVVPCQRVSEVAGSPEETTALRRAWGARFLLRGAVRRDATTAKVSAGLVDTRTGRQVWAGSYKLSLEAAELIATQEEIAARVVSAIASEHGIIAERLTAESRKKRPAELSTYEAMLRYYSYQIAPSPEASRPVFQGLQAAVEREPDYGPPWSALATLYCQMYVFDAPGFDDPLATGLEYAQRGVLLEPKRQLSRLIVAYALLLSSRVDSFRSEAETVLELNPHNPYAVGTIGYMQVLAGDFDQGRRLLERAMAAGPVYPRWFHNGLYLERFHARDYPGARDRVQLVDATERWQPVMLAAVLGKLGLVEEAAPAVAQLLAQKPDFCERGRGIIERSVKSPRLVDDLIDGLRKAGLDMVDG
jgi:adenylate cyclase